MKLILFYYSTWDHDHNSIIVERPGEAVEHLLRTLGIRLLREVYSFNTDEEKVVHFSAEGIVVKK